MFIANWILKMALRRSAMFVLHVAPDGAINHGIAHCYKHVAPPEQRINLYYAYL